MKIRNPSTRVFLSALMATVWLVPAAATRADEAQVEPEAASESEADAKPERPQRPTATRNTWWNDPRMVEALDLSQDQRDQMDEIYKKYLEDRPTPTERGARREPFTAALTAGDMKQARKNLDVLVEDTGAPVRAHGELKIHVLSLLTKEQHATLSRDHKDVITRSWIPRSGRMAGGPRGPRRPGPGARKAAQ